MNRRAVGSAYERQAEEYLKTQGYEILSKNYRNRSGEIDLIAKDGEYLCFVEVKYRRNTGNGYAAEAVDRRKQRTICRVARWYLMQKQLGEDTPCRFDVVAVEGEKITLIRDAFPYIGD